MRTRDPYHHLKFREDGIQVAIERDKKAYTKWFPYRFWSATGKITKRGQQLAKQSAIKWRDDMLAVLSDVKFEHPPKSNTGVKGVSLVTKYDKRRNTYYLEFLVNYKKDQRNHAKHFYIGRADGYDEDKYNKQYKAALAFRKKILKQAS